MIKKSIIHIIVFFTLALGLTTYAQQDPQFTQYMYNMSVINPAYAQGDDTVLSFGLLHRNQWVGSVGGPTTTTFFGRTALTERMEGGMSFVNDEIGDVVNQLNAYADIAYVIPVNDFSKLSFGIKAGATFFNTNFDGFVYSDPDPDPAFAENINRVFPNVGVGLFYFSEKYYFGLSTPNLFESEHLDEDSGIITQGSENIHIFFTGGYVFDLNDKLKLKNAFMLKHVANAPLSLDLTANVLLNNKVEFGVGYRFDDSLSGLFNIAVSPSIRLGYAYDHTLSNLGGFNSGSHEIMLLFDINRLVKGYDKSPRFF